jgi:hypothetical protein
MAENGDLEARMDSVTTFEEKGSNARGGHTEDNLAFRVQLIAEGIVEIGLASAPRPIKKEDLPCSIGDGREDLVKGSVLIWVQVGNVLFCQSALFILIVYMLFLNKMIV